ncbi:MAG: DEAD/DEAH box helicase, partial [Peptococcaceae bacterium]|nr:DEAD/DEAH box helicase [Peptococcaceae bacterium]
RPLAGDYTSLITGLDEGVAHGVFLHELCFPSQSEEHIILSPSGSIQAISDFMIENYALPEEWGARYPQIFQGYIDELHVFKNPLVKKFSNLRAFKLSITEEEVVSIISVLLQEGELTIPENPNAPQGYFIPGWDMKEYLRNNAESVAAEIEALQPYQNSHDPNRRLLKHIATMGRIPLPAQADAVQAVYNRLMEANYAFINGEMGSGKSIMFDALVNAWYRHKNKGKYTPILITAPASVIPKWVQDELGVDFPHAQIRTIESTEDALKYIREVRTQPKEGLEIILLSMDRAKLGPRWAGSAIWKRITGTRQYAWHCPDCFEVLNDPDLKDEDGNPLPARWEAMALSEKGVKPIHWNPKSKLTKCHHCGSKLWSPATKQKNDYGAVKNRWPISRLFQKYLPKHFEIYGADEIHKQKNESLRGDSFGQLVKSAKKVVGLTGTLTNGMSTAVKELLWHMAPQELLIRGFDHRTGTIRWANTYGAVESRRREVIGSGGRVRRTTRVVERPGISPRLTVEYLLGCTVFLELKDLGFPLVEKREIPVFINMDPQHQAAYTDFHRRLNDFRVRGARGSMVPATINYADNPSAGAEVCVRWRYRSQTEERIITAPRLPGYSAKERKMIEIVQENLAEDRGCVIFTFYTGEYNINSRIKKVLKDHGIGCAVLPSSLSPDQRVSWLEKKAEEGQKVIISNLNLIGEGLDL